MPSKKASKKTAAKKSGSSGVARKSAKQSAKQSAKTTTGKTTRGSSPGLISQAKNVVLDVVVGAVSAVAEVGSKATGIGQPAAKKKSARPKGKGK